MTTSSTNAAAPTSPARGKSQGGEPTLADAFDGARSLLGMVGGKPDEVARRVVGLADAQRTRQTELEGKRAAIAAEGEALEKVRHELAQVHMGPLCLVGRRPAV